MMDDKELILCSGFGVQENAYSDYSVVECPIKASCERYTKRVKHTQDYKYIRMPYDFINGKCGEYNSNNKG